MTEREDLPEPRSYLQAARFSGERPAGRAYVRIQALLFRARADLSAYRFHLERVWHVAVLGQEPPQTLDRRIRRALASGEPATLPEEILTLLWERRAQAIQIAPWVEGHHDPGLSSQLVAETLF